MDSSRAACFIAVVTLAVCIGGNLLAADTPLENPLAARHRVGEIDRVEVSLEVGGDMKLVADGAQKELPMSVVAKLNYDEQLLAVDSAGRPTRTLRYYDEAAAVIKVDKGGEKPSLDKGRRQILVEKPEKAGPLLCSTSEPLTREELDLIDVPGNSLLVDRLLPEGKAAGERWKLNDEFLSNLLGLEAVSWSDFECVMGTVTGDLAEIAGGGSLSGAVGGISTEIELKAKCKFDLKRQRIIYLAMLIKEKRAIGHIGPGLDTVAKLIVRITPVDASEHLKADAPPEISQAAGELSQLSYTGASGQYRFLYDRRWYVTSDEPKLTVLRLLDRGELVAQCNISTLPSVAKAPTALAEFQHDVQTSLGKNFSQFVSASQSSNAEAGTTIYRIVARGIVSELPIEWIYYLVADQKGQRVSLAFTYEQSLEERFAHADRLMVNQLRLTEPPSPTAARPR